MSKKKNYLALAALFLIIALIAFAGFKTWTDVVLPNIFSVKSFPPSLFYSFALLAGLISFFAPCALGILPAYAAYYLELKESNGNSRLGHSARMGFVAALGIFSLYMALGIVLTVLGTSAAAYFAVSKPIIAALLLAIGIGLVANYSPRRNYVYRLIQEKIIRGKAKNSLFFFGILYGASALGCAMLVFVPLVIIPLSTGRFLTGILSFMIYSLAFGLAMVVTTVLIAQSKNIMLKRISSSYAKIKKAAGATLILSAIYLLYYYARFGM